MIHYKPFGTFQHLANVLPGLFLETNNPKFLLTNKLSNIKSINAIVGHRVIIIPQPTQMQIN